MCGLWGVKYSPTLFTTSELDAFGKQEVWNYHSDANFMYQIVLRNHLVYSHVPDGLFADSREHVQVIEYPIKNDEFCGNVVLFKDDQPYHEFTHQT